MSGLKKTKSAGNEVAKRKRGHRQQSSFNFKSYIHQLLKDLNSERTISSSAMDVINDACVDMYSRIKKELELLPHPKSDNPTLNSNDIKTVVKFVLPGEIHVHAINHADKALHLFDMANEAKKSREPTKSKKEKVKN